MKEPSGMKTVIPHGTGSLVNPAIGEEISKFGERFYNGGL